MQKYTRKIAKISYTMSWELQQNCTREWKPWRNKAAHQSYPVILSDGHSDSWFSDKLSVDVLVCLALICVSLLVLEAEI